MSTWIDLGPVSDFPPGAKVCTKAEGNAIIVINLGGTLHVLSNVCPHAGLPLGDGEVAGKVITCPYHGYTYNIETGCNIDYPREEPPVPRYAVRVVEDRVQIELPDPQPAERS